MLDFLNDNIIWGAPMLAIYLIAGIIFSVKLRFSQVTQQGYIFRSTLFSGSDDNEDKSGKNLSPLQTLTSALATTLGTGNIVAVGGAVAIGGAGAVFWMIVSAFLGMATCYAENFLGMKYREKRSDGTYFGGAFHYITAAFGHSGAGKIYALLCLLASVGMGNLTQINAMSTALYQAFDIPAPIIGAVGTAVLAFLIFGGIRFFGKVTEKLIPIISIIYILGCFAVIFTHIQNLPAVLIRIITEAFDFRAVSGGFFGSVMMRGMSWGVRRGVFSNEAGLGSSVMMNSATRCEDAQKQGMWAMLQVFFDTVVMCTLTALTLLVTGADKVSADGVKCACAAFGTVFGNCAAGFVALSISVFAITTAAGWSVYGTSSLEYLGLGKFKKIFLIIFAAATFIGATMDLEIVWKLSDLLNGLMAIPNLPSVIILSNQVTWEKRNVSRKRGSSTDCGDAL